MKSANPTIDLKILRQNYVSRTLTLMNYLRDIRKYGILTEEEETSLFKIIKNNPKSVAATTARQKLICHNQRFVLAIAKLYEKNDNILDLINEGNLGLMEAIESFDISKKVRFNGWAVWYVRRSIHSYNNRNGNLIRKTNLPLFNHKLSKIRSKFYQQHERYPTEEELCDILSDDFGITIKNPNDLIDMSITEIDCGDIDEDDNTNGGSMLAYNQASSQTNYYESVINQEYNINLVQSLLSSLPQREQDILRYSFGIGYERYYEMTEIAEKIGLTVERVRQIKATALEKLKRTLKYNEKM